MSLPEPAHATQWAHLQQSRQRGRMPHALLLAGPAGVGKTAFAQRLAQSLLCTSPTAEGHACGDCRGCHLFQVGNHPDFHLIQPEEAAAVDEADTQDASGARSTKKHSTIITIAQIRALPSFVNLTSHQGGYKVVLIAPADRMNVYAANSLLKTLEEPLGQTVLILVTTHLSRLLPTVRSRCQRINFPQPARLSQNHADAQQQQPWILRYDQLLRGECDPIAVADHWAQDDVAAHLRWLIDWHMDMIRHHMGVPVKHWQSPHWQSYLSRWAAYKAPTVLFTRLDALIKLQTLCTTTQVNILWALEAFFAAEIVAR